MLDNINTFGSPFRQSFAQNKYGSTKRDFDRYDHYGSYDHYGYDHFGRPQQRDCACQRCVERQHHRDLQREQERRTRQKIQPMNLTKTKKVPKTISEEEPQKLPQNLPQKVTEKIPQKTQQKIPHKNSKKMPQNGTTIKPKKVKKVAQKKPVSTPKQQLPVEIPIQFENTIESDLSRMNIGDRNILDSNDLEPILVEIENPIIIEEDNKWVADEEIIINPDM